MTGPIIGSAMFEVLGYERMFYVYGGAVVVFALFLRYSVPEIVLQQQIEDLEELNPVLMKEEMTLNEIIHDHSSKDSKKGTNFSTQKLKNDVIQNSIQTSTRPSYCSLLSEPRYLCAFLAPGLFQNHFCVLEPLLAQRLILENLTTI